MEKCTFTETEKARQMKSKVRSLLIFYYVKRIVRKEFILAHKTVSFAHFFGVLW
jgi:hypothetical protein